MKNAVYFCLAYGLLPGSWPAAWAQAGEAGASRLDEVIVTAQRREESLQDAPLNVTAVTARALEAQGASSFAEATSLLPNTQVYTRGGPRVNISMRGISLFDFSPGSEPPVAVHINGGYLSQMTSLNGLFHDIERIEALPGPQGTLYGRNAAAGVINIVTNRPQQEFGGSALLEYGNYDRIRVNGMLNVPVTAQLAIRGAFTVDRRDGYYETGQSDADLSGGRLSALWQGERATLYVVGDYTDIGGKGWGTSCSPAMSIYRQAGPLCTLPSDPFDNAALFPTAARSPPSGDGTARADFNDVSIQTWGVVVDWSYDLDFAKFTAIYQHRDSDEDTISAGRGLQNPAVFGGIRFRFGSELDSLELRLSSRATAPLQWQAGVFTYRKDSPALGIFGPTFLAALGPPATYDPMQTAFMSTPVPPTPIFTAGQAVHTESETRDAHAGFAQLTWTPVDALRLTLGLRYSKDETRFPGAYAAFRCADTAPPVFPGTAVATGCSPATTGEEFTANNPLAPTTLYTRLIPGRAPGDQSASWDSWDYRAGIAYDLSPDSMIYANVATGFRSGALFLLNTAPYEPEDVISYEVGWKNQLLDGRAIFNISAYYTDYESYVQIINNSNLPAPLAYNIKAVELYGLDVQSAWLITPDTQLALNVEYISTEIQDPAARLVRNISPTPVPNFISESIDGYELPAVPNLRAIGTLEHTIRLGSGGTVVPRVQLSYEGSRYHSLSKVERNLQGSFVLTDLQLTYRSASERFHATLYGNNLTDERVMIGEGIDYRAPRTYGVRVGMNF